MTTKTALTTGRPVGFSLVELLISISCIALIASLAVVALRNVSSRTEATSRSARAAQLNNALLRAKLDGFNDPAFQGTNASAAALVLINHGYYTTPNSAPIFSPEDQQSMEPVQEN